MNRLFASIFICLCILLGNISVQSKTFKIVDHISSEHISHEHRHQNGQDDHHHHPSPKKSEHKHHIELSLLTVCMTLPSFCTASFVTPIPSNNTVVFFSINEFDLRSFSSSIFRPPIV